MAPTVTLPLPGSICSSLCEWCWRDNNNTRIKIQPCTTTHFCKPLQFAFNQEHGSTRLFQFWSKPLISIPGQRQKNPLLVHGTASHEKQIGTQEEENEKSEHNKYQALLRGGEQVTCVLQEMTELLADMNMDAQSEHVAVEMVAQGVVGKRVEKLDASFMMALDFMLGQSQNDIDQRKWLLELIKDTVLSFLTKKLPSHVQVVGMLCRTPRKESRQELLRRVAGGGGTFNGEDGSKVVLPKANLNDIANQADDLLETMEKKPSLPDRRLLARLVLVREESRSMMGGGILDERINRGLDILPDAEVEFVSKLVGMKPGPAVSEKIKIVMRGRNEGADKTTASNQKTLGHSSNQETQKRWPVRPGTFMQTLTKVLGGMYETNVAGVTVQHLEWVYKETLNILQEIAFDSS